MQTVNRDTLRQFENRLLMVERSASLDLPFGEFFEQVQKAIQSVGEVSGCTVWLYNQHVADCIVTTDATTSPPTLPSAIRGDTAEERVVTEPEKSVSGESVWCCRCFDDVSRTFTVCLEIRSKSDPGDNFLFANATLALSECLASWFRRSLIARMDEKLVTQTSVTEFCHKTYPSVGHENFAALAAAEIRLLLKVDRVTLLAASGPAFEIAGISGSDRFDRSLETPQALRQLADVIFDLQKSGRSEWLTLDECRSEGRSLSDATSQILAEGGTSRVRAEQIVPSDSAPEKPTEWRYMAELFGSNPAPSDIHWATCKEQIRRVLLGAPSRRGGRVPFLTRVRKSALVFGTLACLFVAGMIPMDFEIDAAGEFAPVAEQKFFAPGNGIIEELSVSHESLVEENQTLLRIHSPELSLRIQELLGELETERVRLSSLQRTRLSAENTSVGRDGVEQALGGEQAVRQRITDLESRLQLLKTQEERLTLKAGRAGRVYRRNLQLDLKDRPVQQGDFLFDLIEEDSDWRLKLKVPEELVKYLPVGENSQIAGTAIRFRFAAEPGNSQTATLQRLEEAVVHENSESHCVAYGIVDEQSIPSTMKFRQPGASVSARISCGRRAAGFVLFREFNEFVREKWFLWFG